MVLICFGAPPSGRYAPDDRLRARMHMHVLDANGLIAAALQLGQQLDMPCERHEELSRRAGGSVELRYLVGSLCALQKLHRQVVRDSELAGKHGLDFIRRPSAVHDGDEGVEADAVELAAFERGGPHKAVQFGNGKCCAVGAERVLQSPEPA